MTDQNPDPNASSDAPVDRPVAPAPIELEIVKGAQVPAGLNGGPHTEADGLSVPPEYRPRKSADVLELDMGDGAILYDNEARLVHHLNPSATLIWQLCDGSGTAEELALDIAAEYTLDAQAIADQVMTVIAELDALGLVEDGRASQPDRSDLRPGS